MRKFLVGFWMFLLSGSIASADICPNAELFGQKLINGICWSCLFPMKILGKSTGSGDIPPNAYDKWHCACKDSFGFPQPGLSYGAWLPTRLIEITRFPYCSPVLNGKRIQKSTRLIGGASGNENDLSDTGFYNVHFWAFPLLEIMELLVSVECNTGGYTSLDMVDMTEVKPGWNNAEIKFLSQPLAAPIANLEALSATTAACISETAGKPMDSIWWGGCWGMYLPSTGIVNSADDSRVQTSSLLATRELFDLHLTGRSWKTVGEKAMCGAYLYPMMPKSQYKMSMVFPVAESDSESCVANATGPDGGTSCSNKGCCHNIGASTFTWGEWRTIPAVGEDFVYLLWRYTDCCLH